MAIRDFFSVILALLLVASPVLRVARCESEPDVDAMDFSELSEVGVIGDEPQDITVSDFSSAPGIETVCIFPQNSARLVKAGEETEILVGVNNAGESNLKVIAARASLHFSYDHRMVIQNLTIQEFFDASVPLSTQASFPYVFAVSQYLQTGSFDLVGSIIYEIDQRPYQSIFYNGTIEVIEAGGLLNMESVFLVTLGLAILVLSGFWLYTQTQKLSKKNKKVGPKVEVGTGTTDANMDEWLQGTAYAQTLAKKSKKKM